MALLHISTDRIGAGHAGRFGFLAGVIRWVGEWNRRQQIAASCGTLSDARLRDIGLTSGDLDAALALPLGQDAAEKLAVAANEPAKW